MSVVVFASFVAIFALSMAEDPKALLHSVAMFSRLDDASCAALLACVRWRRSGPGGVLYRQGDHGDTMAIVVSGTLSVRVRRADGTEHEIAQVPAGETLGEMACIDPAERSATVVALTVATICEINRDSLTRLRQTSPATAALITGSVIRIVTRRLREVDAQIEKQLAARVARAAESPDDRPTLKSPERWSFSKIIDKIRGDG